MNRKLLVVIVAIAALLLAAFLAGSWIFSGVILDSPTMSLEESRDRELIRLPADYGLPPPEEVVIDAGDVQLAGWFFENERDGRCAALILHGYRDTRYGALQYTPLFWERGCDLLFYDARGHGASSGRFHTFGYYEKYDGIAALDWLTGRTGLARSDVALVGVSYGAATVLLMQRLVPDVALVLADSAYTRLIEILRYQSRLRFGLLGRLLLPGAVEIMEWRADMRIEDVSPTDWIVGHEAPIFLVHSLQDSFTPSSHAEAIYANSDHARTVLHLTDWGAPHGLSIFVDYPAYKQLFDDFLAQQAPDFGLPVDVLGVP